MVTVEGSDRLEVPAGHFDVYRVRYVIRKNGTDESYLLFATKTCPRLMVREQFPTGKSTIWCNPASESVALIVAALEQRDNVVGSSNRS